MRNMKALFNSLLIRGMIGGIGYGALFSAIVILPSRNPSEHIEWLLLIGVGAGFGLLVGLSAETVNQIRQARENKKYLDWKRRSKQIVRQPLYPED